jgi:membrane-anchored protein YejM (alkaline phosphatase superfamily)
MKISREDTKTRRSKKNSTLIGLIGLIGLIFTDFLIMKRKISENPRHLCHPRSILFLRAFVSSWQSYYAYMENCLA